MDNNELSFKVCVVFLLAFVLCSIASTSDAIAKDRFHVSYLWHHDLKSVKDYRFKVGKLLGRGVTKNLKVVTKGDLFGLIYMRRGDSVGAIRTAKAHTRILRRGGLYAAAAVAEGDWAVLGMSKKPTQRSAARVRRESMSQAQREQETRNLELAVEGYIKRLRKQGRLSADERTGWSVYDFTTGEKLVSINEDMQFQTASLIKPFIAAAFFHRAKTGAFVYGPKSRRHMKRMIHWSDNRSTNWVMRQVGGPKAVQQILRKSYPAIFHDTRIVEYIPAGGKTYRNKASVHDYSRFLYALWNKDIPGAREIRRLMALPGPDRIFTGASDIPSGTRVLNKTGSTARLCGDMGILIVKGPNGKRYPYTVIGVIEKRHKARNYTAWIRSRGNVIRNVSNIIYQGITRHHGFGDLL